LFSSAFCTSTHASGKLKVLRISLSAYPLNLQQNYLYGTGDFPLPAVINKLFIIVSTKYDIVGPGVA
jgi:hypothetical protein